MSIFELPTFTRTGLNTPTPWEWFPHPEVWIMIGTLVVLYLYATRVVGPKAVPRGEPIITRSQSTWYFCGLGLLWIAADWPVHDIAEDYLYSVHMIQHMALTWVVPPMMLMATPEWLARLVLGRERVYRVFRFLTRPLVAGILFNVMVAFSEVPSIVDRQVASSGFHFTIHFFLVLTALLMWNCVAGPLRELRASLPVQGVYLFLMGVVPTIPSTWLIYSQNVVYESYVHPWPSLWGLTPLGDQQLAGFIMRTIAVLYMLAILLVLYFRWARTQGAGKDDDAAARQRDLERIAAFRARNADAQIEIPDDLSELTSSGTVDQDSAGPARS